MTGTVCLQMQMDVVLQKVDNSECYCYITPVRKTKDSIKVAINMTRYPKTPETECPYGLYVSVSYSDI